MPPLPQIDSSEPFVLHRPATVTGPCLFSSPHSGRDYPAEFLASSALDSHAIRSSEDAFVDLLFGAAPDFGAPLLCATLPRAYIDLNRAADELDPAVIEGIARPAHNPRISSGLGVIPRVVSGGRAIYRGKLSQAQAQQRILACWQPWHRSLQQLIEETSARFGQAVLIDCHSMPCEAVEAPVHANAPRPDIVLGDRFGAAAGREVMDCIEQAFRASGLRVSRNIPFAGAYITQAYGRPSRGVHAIQVEINRALYMDEVQITPHAGFEAFRSLITGVIANITADCSALIAKAENERKNPPLAAE